VSLDTSTSVFCDVFHCQLVEKGLELTLLFLGPTIGQGRVLYDIMTSYRRKDLKCVVCRPSSVVRRPSSVVRRPSSVVRRPSSVVRRRRLSSVPIEFPRNYISFITAF
jgi:hypothetical protein